MIIFLYVNYHIAVPLSNILSEKTLAVILLCVGDCYELNKEIISQCQMISRPIVVVTIADGTTLIKLLSPDEKVEISIANVSRNVLILSEDAPCFRAYFDSRSSDIFQLI